MSRKPKPEVIADAKKLGKELGVKVDPVVSINSHSLPTPKGLTDLNSQSDRNLLHYDGQVEAASYSVSKSIKPPEAPKTIPAILTPPLTPPAPKDKSLAEDELGGKNDSSFSPPPTDSLMESPTRSDQPAFFPKVAPSAKSRIGNFGGVISRSDLDENSPKDTNNSVSPIQAQPEKSFIPQSGFSSFKEANPNQAKL